MGSTNRRPAAWLALSLLAVLGAALAHGAAADDETARKKKAAPPGWYVSTIVSGGSAYRITHYWSKGPNMRAETMIGVHPVVTIVSGDRYWVYDELRRVGLEIVRAPAAVAEDAKRDRPFGNDLKDLMREDGERVDEVTMNGVPIEVWRVTNDVGRRTVWATSGEPSLPIRVENFDRASGETATLEYSNWTAATGLPDRAFAPPADLELQRFEYQEYLDRSVESRASQAPVLFPHLLHGSAPR